MSIAKSSQCIVAVESLEITIYETTRSRIGGTGCTGVYSESEIVASGTWKWRYQPQAEPVVRKDEEQIPWCPAHAFGCNPTLDGKCGIASIVNVRVCDCPSYRENKPRIAPVERHMPNCEVFLRESQGRMAEQVRLMVERKQKADVAAAELEREDAPEFKPMVAVPLKQKKRKKGEPLPGQIDLIK